MQIEIIVLGIVQGVSYRYYTQKYAKKIGLVGYVKNISDGSVKIVANGPKSKLEQLIDWCYTGSPYSKVTDVQHQEISVTEDFSVFQILY